MKHKLTIGLAGNPNVGKSTLFNALTGARQHVGNWPGKTIEKKEGEFKWQEHTIKLVDLPGSYSLTPYTEEEEITSDFILEEKPDVVVQIIDAQNLERNLLLTVQLLELGAPLVVALNMFDLAVKEGVRIDHKELSALLNVPVIPINARKKKRLNHLLEAMVKTSATKTRSKITREVGGDGVEPYENFKSTCK